MTLTELNEIKQNYKILELAVDFINPSYNISRAKHLDNARYIICTLTENGIPRTVKANEVARIRLQKPDRTYVYNDCDILDDGRVFITLTEQILAVEGNAVCDIQLTDEETGIIYSTKNFIINIDKTAVNNSVMESTNEFGALNSLIANNKKINDRLNANEKIRQTNEEQRITNENTRQTNEVIRQAQETDRENNTATAILNAEKAVKKANDAANDLQSKLDSHHFVLTEDKGIANGVAELDSNGFIPSSQLPSYVDDVIEGYFYNNKFYREAEYITEITGETGKIYVDLVSNKTYRWSGSAFAVISETITLGETSSTAYRGDRGKSAYDHSQTLHAPANAEENQNTFSNVNVGSTTISADSKTDTLTFAAGDNITITPDAENNKITISSTGGNGDSNHTHNYAGSDTPGGIAFEASSAYNLNISKTNEINFVKPNWTEPHTVHFGYKWADGTSENLISSYYFDNGNKELAPVVASRFVGNADSSNILKRYSSENTSSNKSNYWYKVGTITLNAQYQSGLAHGAIYTIYDGGGITHSIEYSVKVKQQAAMGSSPVYSIAILNAYGFSPSQLKLVITTNTTSLTVGELWCQINNTYRVHDNIFYYRNNFIVNENMTLSASTSSGASTIGYMAGHVLASEYSTNVRIAATNPASPTTFYIPFTTGATANTNYILNGNDGIRYACKEGTASTQGESIIMLGNGVTSGTDGNKTGYLRLYSSSGNYSQIYSSATKTANFALPSTGGTILNTGTTSVTQSSTSGTKVGDIKINETTTTLYVPSTSSVTSGSTSLLTSGGAYTKFSSYLPLSGGTMTGNISFNSSKGLTSNGSIYITPTNSVHFNLNNASSTSNIYINTKYGDASNGGSSSNGLIIFTDANNTTVYGSIGISTISTSSTTTGYMQLTLGNNLVAGGGGSVGNATGRIRLYNAYGTGNFLYSCSNGSSTYTTYLPSATGTLAVASSDVRLKENIKDTDICALDLVNSIKFRQFDWKDNGEHQDIGFVVDELEKLDNHLKLKGTGGYIKDDLTDEEKLITENMNVKCVDTFYLMGYYGKAIQELSSIINDLKEKIDTMENFNL